MDSKKKIALVTGGSRGLGRDMVLNLARKGHTVLFTYHRNRAEADKVMNEVLILGQKAFAFQLDVSKIDTFDSFVQQVSECLESQTRSSRFDYLINNAGSGIFGSVSDTTEEAFDTMMNVHFKGVYFLTQKLLPLLNDGGGIVNVSSGLTRISFPNLSAYASMKGAVETYTKYLAKELGSRNIRANVVAPGAIATDFGGGSNKNDEDKRRTVASLTALGRIGEPEDIGGVVAFLCSPEAGWMNGQRLELSGGMIL